MCENYHKHSSRNGKEQVLSYVQWQKHENCIFLCLDTDSGGSVTPRWQNSPPMFTPIEKLPWSVCLSSGLRDTHRHWNILRDLIKSIRCNSERNPHKAWINTSPPKLNIWYITIICSTLGTMDWIILQRCPCYCVHPRVENSRSAEGLSAF